jgi:hypothetical protein
MKHWGRCGKAGMPYIKLLLPNHSTSEIFGRRWLLTKKARENENTKDVRSIMKAK